MKLNTRFLLLASPIYLIIAIYLISVSHSVYEFPTLKEKLQQGYFQQELMNVQRDLIFLESTLEEGHQQYYSTLTQMMAFYKEILKDAILFPCTFKPFQINFESNNNNKKSSQSKNNEIPKMHELFLLASGWYSTKTDNFEEIMNQLQIKHPHFRRDMGFLMNYMDSIIHPYWYLQNLENTKANKNLPINCKDQKDIKNQSNCHNKKDTVKNNDTIPKVMLNSISGAGIYLPKDDLMLFSPIPKDEFFDYLKEQSVVTTLTNKCRSVRRRIDNPNKKFCLDKEPTMYLTRNEFGKGSISGGLSLKFSYNLGQKSESYAILYVEFTQSKQYQDMITDQLKSVNGTYFITFNDKINTLASFNSKSDLPDEHLEPTLSAQLFGEDSNKQEKEKFEKDFKNAIDSLMKREKNQDLTQKNSTPIQFEFNRKNQKNYCFVAPIEIDLNISRNSGSNDGKKGAKRLEPYTIFFLGYIVPESELLESFNSTKEQIEFIKLIPFIIIIMLCLILIYLLVRKSKQIQLSYVNQIKTLAQKMNEIDPNKIDSGDQLYEEFSTSQEVETLYGVMNTLLKNFKYSHQKFNQDEALILLELSQAKQFYTSLGNNSRVGICCNNIGNIHMQNDRFLEAISEYQEAILMASIEINEAVSDLQKIEQQLRSKSVSATRARSDSQKNQVLPQDISNFQLNSPEDPSKKLKLLKSPKVSSLKNNQIKKQKQSQGNLVTFDSQQLLHHNEVLEAEMNERSRLSSNTTEINETSDQSNPTKTTKKQIEKLRISRTRLLNRIYQLGLALFEYSTREKSDLLYEAVSVFNQCLTLSESEIHSDTVIIRNILVLNKKAFIHTTLGQYSLSKLTIQKARQELSVLKEIQQRIDVFSREKSLSSSSENEYLNVFGLFPVEVLKSKIDLQEAVLELMQFNYRRSAMIFTSILQGGGRYDSQVRKFALESLRNILQNFKVTRGVEILEFQLEKFEKKSIEVIMLIDYSKAMTQNQIITSHLRSKSIFDVLQDSDKIGFVSFNNSIHVNFPMQKKKLYNDLLEKKIRSIAMSSGSTLLFGLGLLCLTGIVSATQNPLFLNETYTSGVVNLCEHTSIFYLHFESRSAPSTDPLVIWLSGGPGCSSLLGLFMENGPFFVDEQLNAVYNPYSWNENANVVYVDQPVGTGFSIGRPQDLVKNEDEVASDFYKFFVGFLKAHPQYIGRPLYITGESFAGHYIPSIGAELLERANPDINLKGLAIGNGWINAEVQYPANGEYAYKNKLIGALKYYAFVKPALSLCSFLIEQNVSESISSIPCGLGNSAITGFGTPKFNVYDITKKCEGPLCYNVSYVAGFLARDDVKLALGVPTRHWQDCSPEVHQALNDDETTNIAEKIAQVLDTSDVKVLLYYGTNDFICNYIGGLGVSETMEWVYQEQYVDAQFTPYVLNGKQVGESKSTQNLTFMKIYNSGHMVPMDEPATALHMLNQFTGAV